MNSAGDVRDRATGWPDGVAFVAGLVLAWWQHWRTTDLVWSLWLSSLVVGYSMIVWSIVAPMVDIVRGARNGRSMPGVKKGIVIVSAVIVLAGSLFMLAFFTVHFGLFHYVHSVFLQLFFPVSGKPMQGFPGMAIYLVVVRQYWIFLPLAFVAERAAFRRPPPVAPLDSEVTLEAIARRKTQGMGESLLAPYKNVVRLHLLIFFFAFAYFIKLEGVFTYAVVYAAYFLPWRLLKKKTADTA